MSRSISQAKSKRPTSRGRLTNMVVVLLGAGGMLGSHVLKNLRHLGSDLLVTSRSNDFSKLPEGVVTTHFDVATSSSADFLEKLNSDDVVINCIGTIKSRIRDGVFEDTSKAVETNALFPLDLAQRATRVGFRVIQIATDCVFSGSKGRYDESDPHDALDVYGKTKSLGEPSSPNFLNIRCSIIGSEQKNNRSLVEWVRSRPTGDLVSAYVNHKWNGVTADVFGKIIGGILGSPQITGGTYHLVPSTRLTKADLLLAIARRIGRSDLNFDPVETPTSIDRTLATNFPEINKEFWASAGFRQIPTVREMVEQMPATGEGFFDEGNL